MKIISNVLRVSLTEWPESLELESTERRVHLSPRVSGGVFAVKGVASSDIDVVVSDEVENPRDSQQMLVLDVSKKAGKYDGSERDRLLFRRMPAGQAVQLSPAELLVTYDTPGVLIQVYCGDELVWYSMYRQWTHALTNKEQAGNIVIWHWTRYYQHVPEVEMRSLASAFLAMVEGKTLAEANRLASRELYALSRNAGWRKLTLREQVAWDLQGQWHRDEEVLKAKAKKFPAVGEYTRTAASTSAHIEEWLDS